MVKRQKLEDVSEEKTLVRILKTCPLGRPGDLIWCTPSDLVRLRRYLDTRIMSVERSPEQAVPVTPGNGSTKPPRRPSTAITSEEFHARKEAEKAAGAHGASVPVVESEQIKPGDLGGVVSSDQVQLDDGSGLKSDSDGSARPSE